MSSRVTDYKQATFHEAYQAKSTLTWRSIVADLQLLQRLSIRLRESAFNSGLLGQKATQGLCEVIG